jgi:hypothetical protein
MIICDSTSCVWTVSKAQLHQMACMSVSFFPVWMYGNVRRLHRWHANCLCVCVCVRVWVDCKWSRTSPRKNTHACIYIRKDEYLPISVIALGWNACLSLFLYYVCVCMERRSYSWHIICMYVRACICVVSGLWVDAAQVHSTCVLECIHAWIHVQTLTQTCNRSRPPATSMTLVLHNLVAHTCLKIYIDTQEYHTKMHKCEHTHTRTYKYMHANTNCNSQKTTATSTIPMQLWSISTYGNTRWTLHHCLLALAQ